jgi:putative nucleotidyltransferase with HDIG domain
LPSVCLLSRVVPELLDSLQNDTLSVDNLVRIARNDSVIAAAILSGANGLRRLRAQPDTADLFAAASLIGTNKLKQIIVKLGLNKLLSEGSGQAFFYEHSLAVAIVAQELAQLVPGVSADEAYIAGILHDIGQLAYFVVDAEAHRRIRQQAIGDGKLLALEAAAFGLDHCALGVLLGSHWQLPPVILQAIQGHHDTGGEGQTSCRRWSTWLKP